MIAPGYVIWGRSRAGGPWESYTPIRWIGEAHRTLLALRRDRPDREYVVLLEGDPSPEEALAR